MVQSEITSCQVELQVKLRGFCVLFVVLKSKLADLSHLVQRARHSSERNRVSQHKEAKERSVNGFLIHNLVWQEQHFYILFLGLERKQDDRQTLQSKQIKINLGEIFGRLIGAERTPPASSYGCTI